MSADLVIHCIFCWAPGDVTNEHVFSRPVRRRLLGVSDDAELTWKDGSSELWAGETGAPTIDRLAVRAVCQTCNNEWMQRLDNQVAADLARWTTQGTIRLGKDRLDAVTRYLAKVLWVIRIGEDWTSGAWMRGESREPEFIPLSVIKDGMAIRETKSIEAALDLRLFVGVGRIAEGSYELIDIPPIPADGIRETQKVRRVNAGIILTLREVGLRMWLVVSGLGENWQVRWPRGVTTLSSQTRYDRLPIISDSELGAPNLDYRGPGDPPDVEAAFSAVLAVVAQRFHENP